MAAATAINNKIYTTGQSITRVVEFTDLEKQSQPDSGLGFNCPRPINNPWASSNPNINPSASCDMRCSVP